MIEPLRVSNSFTTAEVLETLSAIAQVRGGKLPRMTPGLISLERKLLGMRASLERKGKIREEQRTKAG